MNGVCLFAFYTEIPQRRMTTFCTRLLQKNLTKQGNPKLCTAAILRETRRRTVAIRMGGFAGPSQPREISPPG